MESYIQYLEQVLGLKQVILPPVDIQPEAEMQEAEASRETVRVLFIADQVWSPKAMELFQKMREAMKIPQDQVRVLFASQTSLPTLQVAALAAERVVCFSPKWMEEISVDPAVKFLTHNPEDLLQQPALKKATWEDLKLVMKSLGIL